jgi:hypothetical protein
VLKGLLGTLNVYSALLLDNVSNSLLWDIETKEVKKSFIGAMNSPAVALRTLDLVTDEGVSISEPTTNFWCKSSMKS